MRCQVDPIFNRSMVVMFGFYVIAGWKLDLKRCPLLRVGLRGRIKELPSKNHGGEVPDN